MKTLGKKLKFMARQNCPTIFAQYHNTIQPFKLNANVSYSHRSYEAFKSFVVIQAFFFVPFLPEPQNTLMLYINPLNCSSHSRKMNAGMQRQQGRTQDFYMCFTFTTDLRIPIFSLIAHFPHSLTFYVSLIIRDICSMCFGLLARSVGTFCRSYFPGSYKIVLLGTFFRKQYAQTASRVRYITSLI